MVLLIKLSIYLSITSVSDGVTEENSERIASGIRPANDGNKTLRSLYRRRLLYDSQLLRSTRSYCDSETFQVEIAKPLREHCTQLPRRTAMGRNQCQAYQPRSC